MSKVSVLEHYDDFFLKTGKHFPVKSNKLKVYIYLIFIDILIRVKSINYNGIFGRKVDPLSLLAWKKFAKYNPFHFGEYVKDEEYFGFDYFDHKVVRKMIDLYKADPKVVTGMVLTSATEGNLYSMWMAREMFLEKGIKNTILLDTSLTDKSITKLARVVNIPIREVGIGDDYGMSPATLLEALLNIAKGKTKTGVLICLTLGYKTTGSSDNYTQILNELNKFKNKHKNIELFVWMDAASEGFIKPVLENFKPFNNSLVKAVVFDTHKTFFTPYTVGVALFRQNLISKNPIMTRGVLESRSPLPGIALWSFIQGSGKNGIKKLIKTSHNKRDYFLERISGRVTILKKIAPKSSIALTLEVGKNDFDLLKTLENELPMKANIIEGQKSKHYLIKLYFFPDLKKLTIDRFFVLLNSRLSGK